MMDEKDSVLLNKMLMWELVGSAYTGGLQRILRRWKSKGADPIFSFTNKLNAVF
jgi:hypothetical protein